MLSLQGIIYPKKIIKTKKDGYDLIWFRLGGGGNTPYTRLFKYLNKLPPRLLKILEMRYGLRDGKAHSLREIGKDFDVECERIRQLEAKAFDIIWNLWREN